MNDNGKGLIVIVEDDVQLNKINRRALKSEGYDVLSVYTIAEARDIINNNAPDVILLDVKLPDGSGFDLCREIRPKTAAHIIFLTSIGEADGEMEGLDAGGNDYLRKPYKLELLRKRVNNAIKNKKLEAAKEQPQTFVTGNLTLDIIAGHAYVEGVDLLLTPTEFALLYLLAQNENKVLSTEDIYEKVWRQSMQGNKGAVQKRLSGLRTKLIDGYCSHTINTLFNKGYCFEKIEN